MRNFSLLIMIACLIQSGCAAVGTTIQAIADVPNYLVKKTEVQAEICEQKRLDHISVKEMELHEIQDEAEALRLSREILLAKRELERETERQILLAEKEALLAEARAEVAAATPNYKEQLHTDLGLSFDQRVRVGQLQVDVVELEKKMKAWKKQQEALQADYDSRYQSWKENLAAESYNTEGLGAVNSVCGCERPAREKLMEKENLEAPPTLKVLPTEIPLMLPVSLDVAIQNPSLRQTTVRRIPTPKEGLQDCYPGCTDVIVPCPPCEDDRCSPCDHFSEQKSDNPLNMLSPELLDQKKPNWMEEDEMTRSIVNRGDR